MARGLPETDLRRAGRITPAPDPASAPYDQLAQFAELWHARDWPSAAELSAALGGLTHPASGAPLHFVAQTQDLLGDRLHFEQRIAERGAIALREGTWHDLYSALMWLRYPRLKLALNQLQVADLPLQGRGNRTRRQQSLTHVDEAGVLVASECPALLGAIDAHDWQTLFVQRRAEFGARIAVHVFGHALFELGHNAHVTLAGKALLVEVPEGFVARPLAERAALLDHAVAEAVSAGTLGADPAAMPSLPLSGIPGWFGRDADPEFIASAECFRPRPPHRAYDPPLRLARLA